MYIICYTEERSMLHLKRPPAMIKEEFTAKLDLLRSVLQSHGYSQIYLQAEGAMRWLTGTHHQVIDIPAYESTTVHALVTFSEGKTHIGLTCEPWEKNRVRDLVDHGIWNETDAEASYIEPSQIPDTAALLLPDDANYSDILRQAVSPLAERTDGNQYAKLTWLVHESRNALIEASQTLKEGMTCWDVRSLIYSCCHARGIELSMVLTGLSGMEAFLHPVWDERFHIQKGTVLKLAVNARFCDMFHSATQLVTVGIPPASYQRRVHNALQDAALAYADAYRAHAAESTVYHQLDAVFRRTAEVHALPGFEQSAYLHHPGGPLSPLGSRDFILQPEGTRLLYPWAQFAVNPVDCLTYSKYELQGIILPEGPPLILDEFETWEDDESHYDIKTFHGKPIKLPTILTCSGERG